MRVDFPVIFCLACAIPLIAQEPSSPKSQPTVREGGDPSDNVMDAQPKLLRITATVDGTGRCIVTPRSVRYENKQWSAPTDVTFDGEPWANLARTPPSWREVAGRLDLTKAWIVKREGRDVIALEHTPDGFDVYFCDSVNGAAPYEVMIAIPRRR